MNESLLSRIVKDTAADIHQRRAPDWLRRLALADTIARLADRGIESGIRLHQRQRRQQQDE